MDEGGRGPGGPSDELLAQRVQHGDRDALDLLVRRYLRPIHAVCASYMTIAADVEDVVQETFMRAIGSLASYDTTRPFAPWLYEVARNAARRRLSSNALRRMEPMPAIEPAATGASPEVLTQRSEVRRHVDEAAANLPEQQRTAFRLHDVDGYTTAEIAHLMGLTTGTVRSHVHHARRALRNSLAKVYDNTATGS
ncbi:MAG: sigma-70 family RNA polymerase sigma factor [Longimicrobiales bacterium]